MKPSRDRTGQVWEVGDTIILVLRSSELDAKTLSHDVVVLATDPVTHNWTVGAEAKGWLEQYNNGKGWGEGESTRTRIA